MLFAQQCLGISWTSAEGHEPEKQQHCGSEKKDFGDLPSIPFPLNRQQEAESQGIGKMRSSLVLPVSFLPSSFPRCIDVAR